MTNYKEIIKASSNTITLNNFFLQIHVTKNLDLNSEKYRHRYLTKKNKK